MKIKLKDLVEINPDITITIDFEGVSDEIMKTIESISICKLGTITTFKQDDKTKLLFIHSLNT